MENETSQLYQRYNYDNIFNRSVIGGLLYLLNHRLTYEQVWDDNTVETVTVPFAYNFAHAKDQRFAQDNYTFFGRECFSDKFIDGKFDMCPRFAVTYTGSQIESANITNRFVKGNYTKNENGVIQSYTAFMYSIPINMTFEIEGWIDTLTTAFKLEQAIRDTFYKNQTFNVSYRGMQIGCRVGFPETYTVGEKTVTYSFEQDSQLIKMNFTLAVETYQPCFDESMSIPDNKVIERFIMDPNVYNRAINPKTKKVSVKLDPIDTTRAYTAGETITLSWNAVSNSSDVYTVLLYYVTEDGDKHIIDCSMPQHNFFDWVIPANISNFTQPKITFMEDDITIVREPKVAVSPNSNGYVDTGCFIITDPGEFSKNGYMQVTCDYIDASSNVNVHDCYIAKVSSNGVESISYYTDVEGVSFEMANKKKLKYKKSQYGAKIAVGISYPMNPKVSDEIHNILII